MEYLKSILQTLQKKGHNSGHKYRFLILILLLNTLAFYPSEIKPVKAQVSKNITFQHSIMDEVSFQYDRINHWFELSYRQYYMRFKPFAVVNGVVWTQRQIVNYLRNQGASYREIITMVKKTLHWGFEILNIPEADQEKLDYLGFKLTDYNFPLNRISVRTEDIGEFDLTTFSIDAINLHYSFYDLQSAGYTVEIVNRTYLLIGNVKNKADLLIDPITYSAPTISISGGSVGSELTFWDIWNASVSNNWDVASQLDENVTRGLGLYNQSYLFNCTFRFRNPTYFKDTNAYVIMAETGSSTTTWWINGGADVQLGEVVTEADKTTENGVLIDIQASYFVSISPDSSTNANLTIYDSVIKATTGQRLYLRRRGRCWESMLDSMTYIGENEDVNNVGSDLYSTVLKGSSVGVLGMGGTFDRVTVQEKTSYGVRHSGAVPVTTTELRIINTVKLGQSLSGSTANVTFIDAETDSWSIIWHGAVGSSRWYRQYTFNLNVTDPSGAPIEDAEVTIYSHNGSQTVLLESETFANGSIPEQTLTMGYYNRTGGDTIYSFNPYRLEISLQGYELYNQTFTLDDGIEWINVLSPHVYSFSLDLNPESLVIGDYAIIGFLILLIMVAFLVKIGAWTGYIALIPILLMGFMYYDNATDTNNLFWFFIGSIILAIMSTLVSAEKMMNER